MKGRQDMQFQTTHWSLVVAAGDRSDPTSELALATLCERYWLPLYRFARHRGYQVAESQDLTQEFFARLLEKEFLQRADKGRGRFRSFLLVAFKRFLSTQAKAQRALKRGGTHSPLSLDFSIAERQPLEPTHETTPERLFERRWALTLLENVLQRLEAEYRSRNKGARFDALSPLLAGQPLPAYEQLAKELQMSESAVKVAVHRLRGRYRELLREEVAATVETAAEIDSEIQFLLAAVAHSEL